MIIEIELDKNKLKAFLDANLFNENVFDLSTRIKVVEAIEFSSEDSNLLRLLAEDISEKIKEIVASNENTPIETLEELSFDDSEAVRKALVSNANISEELLEDLAEDESEQIREFASLKIQSV